ncbi:flagellar protein FlaF [Paracoccus isoporae]|uniref:Flagellar protein FlaF n=1 Tax=Paracoccus isoporae TaxID=591205 RepID=A0A1G6YK70_9RHOB|nr:flagellar biosynthesis regulator FlaF [Paracoccus isoporae]SDD90702.1 flagellar protein FlaF [Paracoccus isoporae]
MSVLALGGYQTAISQVEDARQAEARLLARLTANLARATARPVRDQAEFMQALHDNDRFWSQIAADLAGDGNRLPETLRAGLISLAGFVLGHSAALRRGEGEPQPLIDINRAVIRGLSGVTGAE